MNWIEWMVMGGIDGLQSCQQKKTGCASLRCTVCDYKLALIFEGKANRY